MSELTLMDNGNNIFDQMKKTEMKEMSFLLETISRNQCHQSKPQDLLQKLFYLYKLILRCFLHLEQFIITSIVAITC